MEYIDQPKGSLLRVEVIISFILLVVTLFSFKNATSEYLLDAEEEALGPIKFFMLGISILAFLILLLYGIRINRDNLFIWYAVFYVFAAVFSTFFSGLYIMSALPFKFIRLSYWVWVMVISYYAVLHLNTFKHHVLVIVLFLPFWGVAFYRMIGIHANLEMGMNAVFYITFAMPALLLVRSRLVKYCGLLFIFIAVLFSYKRSAVVSFVTAIPVYLYAVIAVSKSGRFKKMIPVLLGATFLLIVLFFLFNYVSEAVGLDWGGRMESMTTDRGSGRLDRYIGYLGLLRSQSLYAWIMGNGYAATAYTPHGSAHNDFIEILYDFGLVGAGFYLLFVVQLLKIFFQMKAYKYRHLDAYAVSLVIFFWGSMFSMLAIVPFWHLNLAFFWGWVVADFHNAKRYADDQKIALPAELDEDYYVTYERYPESMPEYRLS
ncbi:MAG: hypothetical protein LLF76_14810 [Planctomycetaceae bacterium]|nr:hypothetical protein [Planctomycetaceae bacterium]